MMKRAHLQLKSFACCLTILFLNLEINIWSYNNKPSEGFRCMHDRLLIPRKIFSICFIMLFASLGCRANKGEKWERMTKMVPGSEIVISPETHSEIIFPIWIRTMPDYFLLYDSGQNKVFSYTYSGEKIFEFGDEGRGPGEFQSLTNCWIMNDHIELYDFNQRKIIKYDLKGTFIEEYLIGNAGLSGRIEMLGSDKIVSPAQGESRALMKVYDHRRDSLSFIGKAIGGPDEIGGETTHEIIRRGRIPNYMKNSIFLGTNASGIFSFQETTALLQKYSNDGELLWEIDLKIPSQEMLYEEFMEELNEVGDRYIPSYSYAHGIHTVDQGTAILLNTSSGNPVTVAWITNDGSQVSIFEYPDIENTSIIRFRVKIENNTIFFINPIEGYVYKSDFPLH